MIPTCFPSRKKWSKSQDKKLLTIISQYGDNLDWESVANSMNIGVSSLDCYLHFKNSISPEISSEKWTEEEDRELLRLVGVYSGHDWDLIAEDLSTNRTPVQCLTRYQRHLNPTLVKSEDWTAEEDQCLEEALRLYGEGNWQHVSNSVEGRSVQQCMSRARKLQAAKTGRWSEEDERRLFLAALALHAPSLLSKSKADPISEEIEVSKRAKVSEPKEQEEEDENSASEDDLEDISSSSDGSDESDKASPGISHKDSKSFKWREVARFVPGRSDAQCREKWVNYLDPGVHTGPFSAGEDATLLAAVAEEGPGHWAKISRERMPDRSDSSLALRWKVLAPEAYRKYISTKRRWKLFNGSSANSMDGLAVDEDAFQSVLTAVVGDAGK